MCARACHRDSQLHVEVGDAEVGVAELVAPVDEELDEQDQPEAVTATPVQ